MSFAIVHHGNQYLITDGYNNREGLSELLAGFSSLFALHLEYRVPFNLHFSGTLIEAIAWHNPNFLEWLSFLHQEKLLEIVGSTYSQNIMPLFSAEHNLRQMNEALALYKAHLHMDQEKIKTFWVPERVWNSKSLAPLLTNSNLLNGGYRSVILDDRIVYPTNGSYNSSARQEFDKSFILHPSGKLATPSRFEHLAPYRLGIGNNLVVLSICRELRYVVPPQNSHHWKTLQQLFTQNTSTPLLLYADDLEKAVRIGSWGSRPWQMEYLEPYEKFLAWLSSQPDAEPVLLNNWLEDTSVHTERDIDDGTYFEISLNGNAGEDYKGWWESNRWLPYRQYLLLAENELLSTPAPVLSGELQDLAWKQFMACSYETAWHNFGIDGQWHSAPWAKALALHVRSVFVICEAARVAEQIPTTVHIEHRDIDYDGCDEIILYNQRLYAVFSPAYGGRLIYLFDLLRKTLVIGNPADDWHWYQEQNIYPKEPDNHPGALADIAYENELYTVNSISHQDDSISVEFINSQVSSAMSGAKKRISLASDSSSLQIAYACPSSIPFLKVEFALSPDYLALLREGHAHLTFFETRMMRGVRKGTSCVWVSKSSGQATFWDNHFSTNSGHCFKTHLIAYQSNFDIEIGLDIPKHTPF